MRKGRRAVPLIPVFGRAFFASACLLSLAGCAESGPGSARWVRAQAESARERLSESEGGLRVLDAIEAQGGLEAWYSAPTSAYFWEYSNVQSSMRFKSYLVADNVTRQVYHDLVSFGTPDAVEPVEARFAWDGTEAWISPGERRQPNPRFWSLTGYYFQSIPFVMADPGVRFRVLPPEELEGIPHERVMAYYDAGVGDSSGDVYVLYLDPDTGRVAAIVYTVTYGRPYEPSPDGPEPPSTGTLLFYQDYATVDGLTVPTRFRGYAYQAGDQGAFRNEAWVSEISFRIPFDESRLARPADARVEPYPIE
ncbi:MAG: hypothetical protein WEG36_13445 [Gemmatimonadota bacterium]